MIRANIPAPRRAFWPAVFLALAVGLAPCTAADPAVFCAYNLKNWLQMPRPAGSADPAPLPKPESEKARIISVLQAIRPDILGVCEIGSDADLRDLQARLKAAGVELPNTHRVSGADGTRSLALLTRHPIRQRHDPGPLEYQMDHLLLPMQRGILDVTLEIAPGFDVRCVGVHLKSKRPVPGMDEALMRRNEAHLLRRHLDGIFARQPRARVVCYGDFNEHRNEPAIGEIIGSRAGPGLMTDLLLKDDRGQVWTHFWDAADVYARLDYFFVSRALRPHVVARRSFIHAARDFDKASDHRPIVLTLQPEPLSRRSEAGE